MPANKADVALHASEDQLHMLIQGVTDYAIFMLDLDGYVQTWNTGAQRINGYSTDEIVGQHMSRFYAQDDVRDGKPQRELQVAAGVGKYEEEGWRVRKDGRRFWASVSITALRDSDGALRGFAKVTRDLTERKQALEQLRISEERFQRMVESVRDYAIFMLDTEGRVQSWNSGAKRIKGYEPEEIIGQHFSKFYLEEDLRDRKPQRELEIAARTGTYEEEGWRLRKDGSRFWASVVITAVHDRGARLTGFAKVTRDVTERRESERVRSIVDNVVDGIITLSEVGIIESLNPAAERIFGYQAEELLGRDVRMLAAGDGAVFQQWAAAARGGSRLQHIDGKRKDGSGFQMEMTLGEFSFLGRHAFTAVIRDITERRALEEELRKRYEDLREADRRKDEFLAMLAHELRNPLAPVRSATDLLRMRGDDRQTVEFVTDVLDRQVGHLARLVDDLLDVARITRGSIGLRRARLDLARLVGDVVEDHRRAIEEAGLSPQVQLAQAPVWMNGDATRIAQMLGNLLSNAVKFTPRGGVIAVCLSVDPAHCNASLVVRDTGVGMDREMLPRIFEVFSQADRTLERKGGGLGLGLSIVKGLIDLHGGTIEAQSEGIGKGARFSISLPLSGEPPALTKAPAASRLPSRIGERILIVEDNADAARTLKMLLELQGYAVSVAFNAQDGLRLASEWQPSAVLCDIGLPGMDGFAVAKELRRNPVTGQVRLIAITGYGKDEDREEALRCGFDEHIVKPADPELLLEKLDGFTSTAVRTRGRASRE